MIRRQAALAAIFVAWIGSCALAQELTTDAERDWRTIRSSDDTRTKLMAERWYNAVRQRDWSDASGKFNTSAKYVEHDPDLEWVKLRMIRGTGKEREVKDIQIPLDKLSKVCQARVRTISVLAPKVAEAIEEEANKDAEDENDPIGARGGEFMGEDPAAEESLDAQEPIDRRGRGERDPSRRDRRDRTQAEEPPVVTNDGPPLPAVSPPLPSRSPSGGGPAAPAPTDDDPSGFHHPTSADELKATFIQAFDAGDKETLEHLFFWGDLAVEQREATHSSITKDAGVARIIRADLETQPEPVADYTINSTTLFEIEYESRAANVTISWPFAEVDGKFYFGAWIPKARPESR